MEVAKVTVGGLIDHLEASGLVERRSDPKDRRTNRVVITELGYKTLVMMSDVGHQLNLAALENIPEEHVRIAEQVLSRMKANIIAMLGDADVPAPPTAEDPVAFE
jgi:DNA-binding MarR family transcriptional regulator